MAVHDGVRVICSNLCSGSPWPLVVLIIVAFVAVEPVMLVFDVFHTHFDHHDSGKTKNQSILCRKKEC